VGEFRGAEMVDLVIALNTGHDGGAATMHANSVMDVPSDWLRSGLLAGVTPATVTSLASSAFDVLVHLSRAGGRPQVREIGLLEVEADRLVVTPVWSDGLVHPGCAGLARRIAARGEPIPEVLRC